MPDPRVLLAALAWYAAASLVAATAIVLDKRRAERGSWRIPEARLHLFELLGGWPGSFIARHLVRHKTRKLSYRITLWLIAVVHVALWGGFWILAQDS